MARQCLKSERKRNATWFKDKVLLVETKGSGNHLNEEELAFLAHPEVAEGLITQTVITHNAAYQADDLDAYDSDCDDISTAKALLMANLSSYGSDVLSEDINSSTQQDAMILSVFDKLSNQVTNCNKVNKDNLISNESLFAELKRYKERVKLLEERQNVDLSTKEKLIMDAINQDKNAQFTDFEKEINSLKQTLYEQLKEKETLKTTFKVLKNKSKEKEAKNIDKEIALENKVKELDTLGFQNPFYLKIAKQIRPMLYDGTVIDKETNVISIADSEETLMLEEENIGRRFIPQQELSDEQAFWLQTLHPNTGQSASSPIKINAPRELPKGKGKKQSHKPIYEDTNQEKLYHLYMDLCGPMRVASVNEKKYILVIVDDYSWFTRVEFLASKDEAPNFIIKFLKMIQVRLNATVSENLGKLQAKADIVPVANAPRAIDLADSLMSMSINQDAPSTSIPSIQDQEHSLIMSQGFEESLEIPHFHDDPLHESLHEDSTSQGSSSNVRPTHTPFESLGR
nr:ribonuclease H-like domain-containing protein [Tanacetum cinerariifolium]